MKSIPLGQDEAGCGAETLSRLIRPPTVQGGAALTGVCFSRVGTGKTSGESAPTGRVSSLLNGRLHCSTGGGPRMALGENTLTSVLGSSLLPGFIQERGGVIFTLTPVFQRPSGAQPGSQFREPIKYNRPRVGRVWAEGVTIPALISRVYYTVFYGATWRQVSKFQTQRSMYKSMVNQK